MYGSCWKRGYFNPRAPYGARRAGAGDVPAPAGISIHAPHTGRDSLAHCSSSRNATFQSTRPIRGATRTADLSPQDALNFNPRAPYGARRCIGIFGRLLSKFQSTRPIRGATILCGVGLFVCGISIHAPHTGRDTAGSAAPDRPCPFQSTRPIRGATIPSGENVPRKDFNPRAPYGARLAASNRDAQFVEKFQSTRPIRGATCHPGPWRSRPGRFQSTRPIRGATHLRGDYSINLFISIHAPHTGRDVKSPACHSLPKKFQSTRPIRGATLEAYAKAYESHDFNPRAPYGARLTVYCKVCVLLVFQSTRPIRGATRTTRR